MTGEPAHSPGGGRLPSSGALQLEPPGCGSKTPCGERYSTPLGSPAELLPVRGGMLPYSRTHVGTPSNPAHLDRVAVTLPSQALAAAAQEAPDLGRWEGLDVPLVRPSSCAVKEGIPSSQRYVTTYLHSLLMQLCNLDSSKIAVFQNLAL